MFSITIEIPPDSDGVRAFRLMRELVVPALDARRADLEAMYAPVMGRPETDPVLLAAACVLQVMERLPDRACALACRFDARWRYAPGGFPPAFDASTLCVFRSRLGGTRRSEARA
jgi:hypothetical protein